VAPDKQLILLVKLPVPGPSEVLLSSVVGFDVVAQQTPLAIIEAPPSAVIFPPVNAELVVIFETDMVAKVGTTETVVNVRSFPIAVPREFADLTP
jgi:hypothetical protein